MIVNIEDLRLSAKRRLPKIFFDYIDGGSFSEQTYRWNQEDFSSLRLRQDVLCGHVEPDLTTSYLGQTYSLPFMLGPVGFLGLYSGGGEQKAARAAHAAGIPFCLSTFSIASLADVRATTDGILHFQLYVLEDRSFCEELLEGAKQSGASTIFVTVDTAITGIRERDVRNGFRSLTRISPQMLFNFSTRPRWLMDVLAHGMPNVRVLEQHAEYGKGALEQAANLSKRIDKTLSWQDISWIRERWNGQLVIKGILSPEDAIKAQHTGADGIVISNHGGRQLDGALSTIAALPHVRKRVGSNFQIMLDGGVRRGTDIIKAIGLGADGVMLGRAYTYGLAAGGEHGVTQAISILSNEVTISMALMGIQSIQELKEQGSRFVFRS